MERIEWNGLVLLVHFADGYDSDEYTGQMTAGVNKKQHAEVFSEIEFTHYDEKPEFDPECDDEEEDIYIGTADALICYLAAASEALPKGTEIAIEYHGSPYWFFHDLIHAEYDSGDGTDIYINSDSERRALLMGAKFAAENGVSLSEIARQLVIAEREYKERFGFETDALESFLDCCNYANV